MNREIVISTSARRYAHALLEIAIKQRNFTTVLGQLEQFSEQLKDSPVLQELFLNPAFPPDKKKNIVEDVGKKLRFERLTVNFLATVIRRDRLRLLDQIIASLEQQFLERQGIMVVEVTTARRLEPAEEELLIKKLEEFTGKKVQLENRIDPTLLGGAVTRIGSVFYDGSVQAQLDQLKRRIIQY